MSKTISQETIGALKAKSPLMGKAVTMLQKGAAPADVLKQLLPEWMRVNKFTNPEQEDMADVVGLFASEFNEAALNALQESVPEALAGTAAMEKLAPEVRARVEATLQAEQKELEKPKEEPGGIDTAAIARKVAEYVGDHPAGHRYMLMNGLDLPSDEAVLRAVDEALGQAEADGKIQIIKRDENGLAQAWREPEKPAADDTARRDRDIAELLASGQYDDAITAIMVAKVSGGPEQNDHWGQRLAEAQAAQRAAQPPEERTGVGPAPEPPDSEDEDRPDTETSLFVPDDDEPEESVDTDARDGTRIADRDEIAAAAAPGIAWDSAEEREARERQTTERREFRDMAYPAALAAAQMLPHQTLRTVKELGSEQRKELQTHLDPHMGDQYSGSPEYRLFVNIIRKQENEADAIEEALYYYDHERTGVRENPRQAAERLVNSFSRYIIMAVLNMGASAKTPAENIAAGIKELQPLVTLQDRLLKVAALKPGINPLSKPAKILRAAENIPEVERMLNNPDVVGTVKRRVQTPQEVLKAIQSELIYGPSSIPSPESLMKSASTLNDKLTQAVDAVDPSFFA